MEVFVLMGHIDYRYKGDYLLGVYASEQEAIDALGVYTRDFSHDSDSYFVDRRVLGSSAYTDFNPRYI